MNSLEQITMDRTLTNDEIQRYLFRLVEELNYSYEIVENTTIIQEGGSVPIPDPTPEPDPIGFDTIYPVGSIYMSVNSTSPAELFGGTWEQIKDTFLLSAGDTYTAGDVGGEATHTLAEGELPSHRHGYTKTVGMYGEPSETTTLTQAQISINNSGTAGLIFNDRFTNTDHRYTQNVGLGSAHNNMPPYLTVYVWKRTA